MARRRDVPRGGGRTPLREPDFPEIEKRRAFDEEAHARLAEERAGLDRKRARAHAKEDADSATRNEGEP